MRESRLGRLPVIIFVIALLPLIFANPETVQATEGYFSSGNGIKGKGRGGVSMTATDDAFGGANNPATIIWATDRLDVGIDYLRPIRNAERTGPAAPLNGEVTSDSNNIFIPELAFKYSINNDIAAGISVYGTGMSTNYPGGTLTLGPGGTNNLLAGSGRLGVDLKQLVVAPTIAWKIAPKQSLGLSPLIGYQWFKASGLDAFSTLSQDSTALTDRGYDHAFGIGVRIGYLCNITPEFSVGAAYSSPVFMQRFEKYRGLFAENGSFDIPQTIGVGLGWQVLPSLRLGADYNWIDYAGVASIGNPSSNTGQLGQANGPGLGWHSISVVKVGGDWKATENLTLRTGYSYNENPVHSSDVTFNILAPGIIQHHLTFGTTYALGRHELSASYVHAFFNSVTGESRFVALGKAPAGTSERITMYQDSVGFQYSFKF